ncbi:MAG: hypothetical protein J6P28_08805 [Treponema sp.]|nr:hypothetical protein [Treponema sp.]
MKKRKKEFMATCYICGRTPAEYRRNVTTGTSYRMTTSSRGTNWNSTSVRQGIRSVCAECALTIDYNNKKYGGFLLSMLLGGLLVTPAILYTTGFNFLHLSGAKIGVLTITGLVICIVGSIFSNSNAKRWKEENKSKYLGSITSNVYKSDNFGITNLDKSIEICKRIDLEDKEFARYQEEINNQIQNIFDETKNGIANDQFNFLSTIDKIIGYKNELVTSYKNFSSSLETASKDFKNITTAESFLKYQSGINGTQNDRKKVYDIEIETIDNFIASLFKIEVENVLVELNKFLKENNKDYPVDTIEDCDTLLKDLAGIGDGITSYLNIGEKKYSDLLVHINENSSSKELLRILENLKNSFEKNVQDCFNRLKEIENKVLQKKIELLQRKE